ncbi:hypothetical protein CXG81DRAFT_29817 [Caulochytrium protostelioides]|uniref:Exosome complex component CSL4 C-terminal domain-containing protein n=1 Tax=Caulochytrium protostelioides TaxID=1555241 RepID=A0A4P9X7F5_9FUNG|nr:hypothetical protein CXG81DRAFT_29817 [Caulochytrium protostelioides]|eukprot:RKP01148.1 hypothetical protein CXG81DRAFT_29817 [Caulochytrium protostelioides]
MVVPGHRLGLASQLLAGPGTYIEHGYVLAAVAGQKQLAAPTPASQGRRAVRVQRHKQAPPVPRMHSVVLAKVLRVTPRVATVAIQVVDGAPCPDPGAVGEFMGHIRAQDVRATDRDSVVMYDCFAPGDLVRCTVVSLGDVRNYFLSCARNGLGVILAKSAAAPDTLLVPISWTQMRCPKTGTIELRKVAQPSET